MRERLLLCTKSLPMQRHEPLSVPHESRTLPPNHRRFWWCEPPLNPSGLFERRTDAGSPERKRMAARAALRERKADDVYQDWLRTLRDRAYVEYRQEER